MTLVTLPQVSRPIDRVLSRLHAARPNGKDRWMAKCPAHDDREASLSVKLGTDGRVMLYCHAKCETPAVVAAIGLAMPDLFAAPATPRLAIDPVKGEQAPGVATRKKLIKSYDYTDANGVLLFQVCRMEPKAFPQRRPDGNGGWTWGLGDVEPVLYRLPEVIEAVAAERRVFVVEGEKDVDTLADLGYVATTAPMGAGKWRASYAEVLAGAEVVVIPDNDEPGALHAQDVARSVTAQGGTVRIIALPKVPPKGDVSDWFAIETNDKDQLEEILYRTPVWSDPTATKRNVWLLADLVQQNDMMRPPPPVVPYLAWSARSTLLAAREKSGKSTLTGYIAARVSRGEAFLGEPCEEGRVLIVGLEEFVGDTGRRLVEFGANPHAVQLVSAFIRTPAERIDEFRGYISDFGPILVILDSLVAYSQGAITDANNSTQTQHVVDGLTRIAHDTGVALVIIHHARKSDGKYRDSSAIGGAVDIIAEVFPPDEAADPTRRRVRPVGRVPAREVDFHFTGTEYRLADPTSGPQKAPLDQRIVALLRDRPGISANAVVEALRESREATLSRIRLMLASGGLLNDGDSRTMRLRVPTYQPAASLL